MSFLAPLFLTGAIAAAVPILLHLFKREPELRVKFAPVMLLKRAPIEHAHRRRLRELLLLALRVLTLLLLAGAFARPFVASATNTGPSGLTVVALDTSMSLTASGQFSRARQAAQTAIAEAPRGHLIGVITFANTARVEAAPSADRALATAAVAAAEPGFGATSYRSAFGLAADLIASHGGDSATVVVVTDMQESGWDQGDRVAMPASAVIEVIDVGEPPPNLAVTDVRRTGGALVATVRNWGPDPREARVALRVDDRETATVTALVGSNEATDVQLSAVTGAVAVVSVEDPDGVAADNERYVALGAEATRAVAVVTATGDLSREAFYLEQALRVTRAGQPPLNVIGAGGSDVSLWDQARVDDLAAVIIVSTRGLDIRGRDKLEQYRDAGGGLLVAVGPDVDGRLIADALSGSLSIDVPPRGGPVERPTRSLAPADVRHPLFRPFGAGAAALGLVTFSRVASIRAEGCQTLARFTSGEPALVECAGTGRALVLASDLDSRWNDFPVHPSFVPFVHEAVRYLMAGSGSRASEYLVGEGGTGVPWVPGVVETADESGRRRWVAVNVDANESNPARLTAEEFLATVTQLQETGREERRLEGRQQEERQHLWQYLLGLMMVAMVVESLVSARSS